MKRRPEKKGGRPNQRTNKSFDKVKPAISEKPVVSEVKKETAPNPQVNTNGNGDKIVVKRRNLETPVEPLNIQDTTIKVEPKKEESKVAPTEAVKATVVTQQKEQVTPAPVVSEPKKPEVSSVKTESNEVSKNEEISFGRR